MIRNASALLLAAALAAPVAAEVVISNFTAAVGTGTAFGAGASTQFKAFGFTMGGDAYVLDDVVLSMNFASPNPVPIVSIWSDASGPGTQLFTLTNPASLAGQMDFTFTAPSLFRLEANTTYWLHVMSSPVNGVAFLWDGTAPSTVPAGIATAVGYNFNGATSTTRNRLEINGTRASGIGSAYCTANSNSTGSAAAITAVGATSVAANDVTLEASGMPTNAFGFFLTSRTQGAIANPGGSQGVLCLGGSIGRYVGPGQIKNSGATGAFSLMLNLTQSPTPTGPVSVVAGETWNFTAWFRDSVGGTATSNFTNGRAVTFN